MLSKRADAIIRPISDNSAVWQITDWRAICLPFVENLKGISGKTWEAPRGPTNPFVFESLTKGGSQNADLGLVQFQVTVLRVDGGGGGLC
jgi:hypothetical protein